MSPELQAATITALATVLAALIGTVGAVMIFAHRVLVVRLAREVETYYLQEGFLVGKLIEASGVVSTEDMVRQRRGIYRTQAGRDGRPSMTANEAIKIRRRYLCFD